MKDRPPIERVYDLGDLSDAGYALDIAASPAELSRIAQWEEVGAVTRFEGRVTLKRRSSARFTYEASLEADVVQNCVVTLEPVKMQIARTISRDLHYSPGQSIERGGAITLAAAEDETPEMIDSLKFDLAAPLLEEFSLAIDPYPKAPGVAFEPPADWENAPESPFAVLKALKRG